MLKSLVKFKEPSEDMGKESNPTPPPHNKYILLVHN